MEKNKHQELPQLRSVTSKELGCDAHGHARAVNDTTSWYCVILAGRKGPELLKMHEVSIRSLINSYCLRHLKIYGGLSWIWRQQFVKMEVEFYKICIPRKRILK
uniref:Heat shock protein binding protein n=1 Tax=Rhizophora mucronata TaxID=61149 RepID=A0A2P2LZ35_RHIMU